MKTDINKSVNYPGGELDINDMHKALWEERGELGLGRRMKVCERLHRRQGGALGWEEAGLPLLPSAVCRESLGIGHRARAPPAQLLDLSQCQSLLIVRGYLWLC